MTMRRQAWVLVASGAVWVYGGCATKVVDYEEEPAAGGGGTSGDANCPARIPRAGDLCGGSSECSYESGCGEPHRATCNRASWSVRPATCAPPCPAEPPEEGLDCWHDALRCDYGSGCDSVHALCGSGYAGAGNEGPQVTWHYMPPSPMDCPDPLCPSEPPSPGSACQPERNPCWFTDPAENCQEEVPHCYWRNNCGGLVHGNCDIEGWHLDDEGCPTDSACPGARPSTGDPCDDPLPAREPCRYTEADCHAACLCMSDGRWACYEVCEVDEGVLIEGTDQPGAVPRPERICDEWPWCGEIGSSCGRMGADCVCTADGMSCSLSDR